MAKATITNISVLNNEGIVGIPTIFTFEFDRDLTTPTSIIFYIDELQVIKTPRVITKLLLPVTGDLKKGTITLTFPEALAGASLKIKYSTSNPDINAITTETNITIKRADGLVEIEKVYWSEHEHAKWGAKLTVQKELCKNETGFLHIYTKGLFGKQVFIKYQGNGGATYVLGSISQTTMRDNVVSVPYAMSKALADYKAKEPTFAGSEIKLQGFASKTNPMTGLKNTEELTLHCNQDATNPQQPTVGTDVKVNITTDEESLGEPTKAKCILQFRPDNTYNGDYGFDWVRMGDTNAVAPGYHHDHDFENYMGKHYYSATMKVEHNGNNHGNSFKKDIDPNTTVLTHDTGVVDTTFGDKKMYTRLRHRFRRLIFDWDPTNATKNESETYTPIMTILNTRVADLVLHLDIKEEPKEILFEFDNATAKNFLDLDKEKITSNLAVTAATNKTNHTLKITCKGEFAQEYTLFAREFKKDTTDASGNVQTDTKGEICAMLRILPNAPQYHFKPKVVFVSCETLLNGTTTQVGNVPPAGRKKLTDILGQALVFPEIDTTASLDLTDPVVDFNNLCCQLVTPAIPAVPAIPATRTTPAVPAVPAIPAVYDKIDDAKGAAMKTLLLNKLRADYAGKYEHYYKIFFFEEAENTTTAGYSWGEKYIICYKAINTDNNLAAHELLHGLELAHPFDAVNRNTQFTYKYATTDNIMDYSDIVPPKPNVKCLYHWQWQIVNPKIR